MSRLLSATVSLLLFALLLICCARIAATRVRQSAGHASGCPVTGAESNQT